LRDYFQINIRTVFILRMKQNILQIMDFAAPYKGNFISSLECLEQNWREYGNFIYLFPAYASELIWIKISLEVAKSLFYKSFIFSKRIKWENIKK